MTLFICTRYKYFIARASILRVGPSNLRDTDRRIMARSKSREKNTTTLCN